MNFFGTDFTELDKARLVRDADELATNEAILNLLEVARDTQSEAKASVVSTLAVERTLCQALVASSAWLSLALYANHGAKRLYPHDWLEPEGHGNPDFIMSCILCQFTNYGHAVIELVDKGLDNPARALLRSSSDLSYMLAVLSADRETFQAYVLDKLSSPKEHWYKLFSNKKIASRISKIDTALGLPVEWTTYMRRFREENNEFFSEAVHHSPNATFVGAIPRVPGSDRVMLAVFGSPTIASGATLGYLATSLNYGLTMFVKSCEQREGFTPEFTEPRFWESGMELYQQTQPIFQRWLQAT